MTTAQFTANRVQYATNSRNILAEKRVTLATGDRLVTYVNTVHLWTLK